MFKWFRKQKRSSADTRRLHNAEQFHDLVQRERLRSERAQTELAVLILELSDGPLSGVAQQTIAHVMSQRLRNIDTAGRLANGRIAVLLPDTSAEGAERVREALVEAFAEHGITFRHQLAVYPPRDQAVSPSRPVSEKDRATADVVEQAVSRAHLNPV